MFNDSKSGVFFAAVLLLGVSNCAVLKRSQISDSWNAGDNSKVKRLAVAVKMPEGTATPTGELMARVARRYTNLKRDFLVKKETQLKTTTTADLMALCGQEEAIEGVLLLDFVKYVNVSTVKDKTFDTDVTAALLRCVDAMQMWSAQAAGQFSSIDDKLTEVTQVYVREMGEGVKDDVAPAHNVLRPLLDALPNPVLTEADKEEKLSVD
jgi:probable lipoprotein (TIGR04455 family)